MEPLGVLGWFWQCQRSHCALGIAPTLTEAHTRASAHIRRRHMPLFDVIEQERSDRYARYSVSVSGIPLGNIRRYIRAGYPEDWYTPVLASPLSHALACTSSLEDAARAIIDVSGLMFEGGRMVIAEGGRRRAVAARWGGGEARGE